MYSAFSELGTLGCWKEKGRLSNPLNDNVRKKTTGKTEMVIN